jgi:hypothetical protein
MMDDEMLLLLLLATKQHDDNHALDSSFYSALDINSCRLRQGIRRCRPALHHPSK